MFSYLFSFFICLDLFMGNIYFYLLFCLFVCLLGCLFVFVFVFVLFVCLFVCFLFFGGRWLIFVHVLCFPLSLQRRKLIMLQKCMISFVESISTSAYVAKIV